jgi:hypothetical protein
MIQTRCGSGAPRAGLLLFASCCISWAAVLQLHTRRDRAQAKLPPRQKAKRIGEKDASAGEAAAAFCSSKRTRYDRGRDASGGPDRRRSRLRGQELKLAPSSAAAARQERAERLRRDRAAAQALGSAFPSVQELRFDMQFEGTSANLPTPQSHVLYPPARAFFSFPCPHAGCDGEFDLTAAVNAAVGARSHRTEGVLQCPGTRLAAHASRLPCPLRLLHRITTVYYGEQTSGR